MQQHLTDLPDDIVEREKKWTQIEEGARKLARLIKEVRVYRDLYEWICLLLKDPAADALQQADHMPSQCRPRVRNAIRGCLSGNVCTEA